MNRRKMESGTEGEIGSPRGGAPRGQVGVDSGGRAMYEGQNAWPLGRLGSGEDDFGQAWDGVSARDGESVAEVVPERDFELGAGFDETEKGIAAITTDIATGAGTDLAPGDVAADVVLRSVGVQWDFGSVEHHQRLGFVGVEPREQAVEGDEAGLALEDAVEPSPQCCLALFGGEIGR